MSDMGPVCHGREQAARLTRGRLWSLHVEGQSPGTADRLSSIAGWGR